MHVPVDDSSQRSAASRGAPAPVLRVTDALASLCGICARWCRSGLCSECRARFLAPVQRCRACGLRLAGASTSCLRCATESSPIEHTVCAVDYAFPWDRLIGEFKFGQSPEHANWLAPMLAAEVTRAASAAADVIAPIPLHPSRLAERGYNQAWEIARRVAAKLRLPAKPDVLSRLHAGSRQASLSRADRLTNLREAFVVEPDRRAQVAGRRVALVDDVMTTGATLHSAAMALRRAGAASVDAWVIARTPD